MSRSNLKPINMAAHFGASKRGQEERLQVATAPIRNGTTRETYTGGELMQSTRAGATDALRLPSVLMGLRTHRKDSQQ